MICIAADEETTAVAGELVSRTSVAVTRSDPLEVISLCETLGNIATSELGVEPGLRAATEAVGRTTGATYAEAWIERGRFELGVTARWPPLRPGLDAPGPVQLGIGIAGLTFVRDETTVADRDHHARVLDHERLRHGAPTLTQTIGLPLRSRGAPVGVIALGFEFPAGLDTGRIADLVVPLAALGPFIDLQNERESPDEAPPTPDIHRLAMVGLLASGFVHDVNNAFTVILGCTGAIDESGEALEPDLTQLRAASAQGARLAHSFLRTLAPTSDARPTADVAVVLDELEPVVRLIAGRDTLVEIHVDHGLETASVDVSQLEQAILNLAANARDAMSPGGRLAITATSLGRGMSTIYPGVRITVTDTGSGMDETTLERAFTPFFTTKRHGSGLGLQSVTRMVEESAGDLRVTSTVGRGTRFEIDLASAGPSAASQRPSDE